MQFLLLVLIFCFFIFLFVLHFLSRDDFILLRKDISVEKIFNIAFITVPVSLFFSRLIFAISHPSSNFLNPLYFLLFPYFPGLSFIGGVLGAGLFLYLFSRSKKVPTERLMDLFAFSMSAAMPLGVLGFFILSRKIISLSFLFFFALYLIFFIFLYSFSLPKFLKGRIKEGTVSLLFIVFVSAVSLVGEFISGKIILNAENVIMALTLISFLTFFVYREGYISKLISKK